MKSKTENVATITDDLKLDYHIPRILIAVLAQIGRGEKVRVDIKKWYKKRTNDQNAVIWGPDYTLIISHILEHTGELFSPGQLHEWHKEKFIGFIKYDQIPGLYKVGSTKDMDTQEFSEFREKYCKFWAENGLYIPDPDPDKKRRKP